MYNGGACEYTPANILLCEWAYPPVIGNLNLYKSLLYDIFWLAHHHDNYTCCHLHNYISFEHFLYFFGVFYFSLLPPFILAYIQAVYYSIFFNPSLHFNLFDSPTLKF